MGPMATKACKVNTDKVVTLAIFRAGELQIHDCRAGAAYLMVLDTDPEWAGTITVEHGDIYVLPINGHYDPTTWDRHPAYRMALEFAQANMTPTND
jgi:hypothetical protein